MQLRIRHLTRLHYNNGADASVNEVRLTPLGTADQQVLRSRLEIRPTPWSFEYTDYWGTQVTSFEVYEPHDELLVVATSVVQTRESSARGLGLSWQDLEALADEFCELLADRDPFGSDSGLKQVVATVRSTSPSPREAVPMLCAQLADRADAQADLAADRTCLAIAALRSIGIPTRYVSGYAHPQVMDAVIGEPQAAPAHAWLEYYDGEWVGYDPTLVCAPGPSHVVLAHGRDARDVATVSGIYSASDSATCEPAVVTTEIEVTRLQ